MARTPSVSDEAILAAAKAVMIRSGINGFSVTAVAEETGLSRAAIILRFKSTDTLKAIVLEAFVEQFIERLEALPKTPSGDSLLAIAAFIGNHAGSKSGSSAYFADYTKKVTNHDLIRLDYMRGAAMQHAITCAMPDTKIEKVDAAALFRAHLSGCMLAWLASDSNNAAEFLLKRTQEWLRLAGIPFTENAQVIEKAEPITSAAASKKVTRKEKEPG